ncbi:MAG: DUF58 domain-containing protein [Thermonemataceae bacterium]|nr:DUF58 domain-containing protein [Thermonemataceae bacterium]
MNEIISKIRKYEIRIRKIINTQMHGDFQSVFKGSGLEFADVRDYMYGDDVRRIDWNVSAKGQGVFVKEFREEKEQMVFFVVDVSASQNLGMIRSKLRITQEICGVLAISAAKENSDIGLIAFSDQKERYIKAQKGEKYAYEMISKLLDLEPKSLKTDISKMILYTLQSIKRRSIIILLSDFIGENYEAHLKALARKHDLIMIQLYHSQEISLPNLGIVPMIDVETKKTFWINTSSRKIKQMQKDRFARISQNLQNIALKTNANLLQINTEQDFVPQLVELFKKRKKKIRKYS